MKTRLITGISGALVAIAGIIFMQIPLLGPALAFFAGLAVHEIMTITKCKNKLLTGVAMAVAAIIPLYSDIKAYLIYETKDADKFAQWFAKLPPAWSLLLIYMFAVFLIMLKYYNKTKFENAVIAFFAGPAIGLGMASMIYVRDFDHVYPEYFQQAQSFTFVLIGLFCCWLADAFAYFFGRKLGKHKLARKISPKKSVEGLIAGVLGTTAFSVAAFFVAHIYYDVHPDTVTWWMIAIGTVLTVLMGVAGDLTASVIKRNFQVKDFGTLFPGHGGVMDRFDSYLFAMPFVYLGISLIMYYVV